MNNPKPHNSQRGHFFHYLYEEMQKNKDIVVITADLGYGMMDKIRDEFADRFINCGASEQLMIGMACGLALEGKIPVCYSITPFLLYRPFETIRNYVDHERIPVLLVGGGRDSDYSHDGFSHYAGDDKLIMGVFKNIKKIRPQKIETVKNNLLSALGLVKVGIPVYINLQR